MIPTVVIGDFWAGCYQSRLPNGHYREPELGLFLLESFGAMPQRLPCETTLGTALSYHYHAHIQHSVLF